MPPPSFLGKTLRGGWGRSPSLLKVGRSFFLSKGTARSCQSQPAGSQRLGVRVLTFFAWLPPPKQKQVPARLQPSPQRGAAQRGELAPRLLRINLLLCPGLLPCSGLPRRLVSLPDCVPHRSGDTAPRSYPLAPSSTQGRLRVQTRCRPCCPGPGSLTRGSGGPGTFRGKPGQWWWPAERTGGSASLGSRGRDTCREPPVLAAPGSAPPARSPAGLTASCSRRPRTRRRPGVAATAGTSGGSWCLGRPAPGSVREAPVGAAGGRRAGRAGAPGRGARRGSASEQPAAPPAAAPAARRTRLSAPPQSRDAAAAAEAGGRPAGRAGGGPRMGLPGRVQRRGTPPPPHGGGPEPAGLGFSWGASPARRPGALGAPARCRHAWPHAAQLGRARGAATQLLGPRPGPLGRAGTAPPARRCGHCSAALAAPRGPPPAPGSRDPRSTPAGRRSHPSAAATRAHTGASAPGAPGCGAARLSPPDPSRPSGPRVLRSGPSLALTSLQPSRSWTGASLLRAAWDSGLRLRESETSLLDRPGFWRAQGSKVLSESLAFLSRPNT